MKTEFKTKFIQHILNKKEDKGFTLIELLVVIIIIGILSAIALPSFLNQANKARESEAKQYIGSTNRAQQAYFLEKSAFTTDYGLLGLGVSLTTKNYTYEIPNASGIQTIATANPTNTNTLRAYVGGVQVGQIAGTGETTTTAVLCQSVKPATAAVAGVTLKPNTTTAPTCGANYETIN